MRSLGLSFRVRCGLAALGLILAAGPAHAVVHSFPNIACLGANVRPTPVASDGIATAEVVYNDATNTMYWTINHVLDSSSTTLTAAHFHGPADVNTAAGVQVDMTPSVASPSGFWSGSAVITEPQEADLLAGLYYINLHSDQFGGGELRGQVIEAPTTESYADRPVDSSQATDPVTGTPGAGVFNGTYNSNTNTLTFAVTWNSLTSPIDASHFHGPAMPGNTAGVQITLHTLPGFDTTATTGLFTGTVSLTEPQETDLLADLWYLNIHTVTNGAGEVRGQIDNPVSVPVELSVFSVD